MKNSVVTLLYVFAIIKCNQGGTLMTFGEKLKKLRNDNGMTQDQLAEKSFVTRTAISKWEANNGYPSIDSLKEISILFGISIDDLISDVDVENKKVLDKKIARRFYYIAVAFLGITVLFAMLAYCLNQPLFNIGSILGMVGFIAFGLLQRPKYKLIKNRKHIISYVIQRVILFAIMIGIAVYMIMSMI